ncbi:MAG: methyltransferase [Rhizobiaceae bacterium]
MSNKTFEPLPAKTVDAFHRGRFWLVQPAGSGHRAGLDAMVLAAAVPAGFSGCVADLGAGAGAAGLAVAARCPQAQAVLVERSPEMADLAGQSLMLEQNTEIAKRASILRADVTLAGKARVEAGLADNAFDFVIMNPPFNAENDRATPDALKRQAHVMEGELWESWLRTAAAIAKPGGGLALIARPESLADILPALKGRFGSTELVTVHPREDRPAIRVVLRARRGARKRMSILPPLVLHGPEGNRFTPRADDICDGLGSLFGD